MKRWSMFFLCAALALTLCGCGGQNETGATAEEPVVSDNQTTDPATLDLTQFSSTLAYSEVYNMTVSPDDYRGKRVKMTGAFSVYTDEATGKHYFACVVGDATACCTQFLEFELADPGTYPQDYPAIGATVTVEGVFDTYTEGTQQYCQLHDAVLL